MPNYQKSQILKFSYHKDPCHLPNKDFDFSHSDHYYSARFMQKIFSTHIKLLDILFQKATTF